MRVVIDFETKDPFISRKMGSGWVYGRDTDFRVLGCGVKCGDDPSIWIDMLQNLDEGYAQLEGILSVATHVICHNAEYDVGCLKYLGLYDKIYRIRDTMIGAKLVHNALPSYSLDALSERYLGKHKTSSTLGDLARSLGLVKNCRQDAEGIAKKNMDLLYEADPKVVAKYCLQDVELTHELDKYIEKEVGYKLYEKYSSIVHPLLAMRDRGVAIDVTAAQSLSDKYKGLIEALECEIKALLRDAGLSEDVNIDSSQQLAVAFGEMGVKTSLTAAGNPSVTAAWMKTTEHPLAKKLLEINKYTKAKNDFVDYMLEIQRDGLIHPQMNPISARTGRFSCSSPNIQQIPGKGEIGEEIRSLFVANKDEMWYSLDYSQQEPRLQVHFAAVLAESGIIENSEALQLAVKAFADNPNTNMHQQATDLINMQTGANYTAKQMKAVNLGITYGMGLAKLAASLNVDEKKAKELRDTYNEHFPFVKQLAKACKDTLENRGWLKSLSGRKLRLEEGSDQHYKAINLLIQGSAADQTIEALLQLWSLGIVPSSCIHDEINLSTSNERAAEKTKEIMEKCVDLKVPVVAQLGKGKNWSEAK